MKKTTRILALLLALCLLFSLAACGKQDTTDVSGEPTTGTDTPEDGNVSDAQKELKDLQKSMLEKMLSLQQENSDTMGWLYIDGTTVDDAVVKVSYNDNNQYYLRRNAKGESDFYGCYFADHRCYAGDRNSLSKNTVIFGHSMSEDVAGVKFSQLKKYLKEDFAEEHPYIYFSTIEDDMVWQIFAVFYTNITFDYIQPNPTSASFQSLLDTAKSLSFYDYGIEVTPNDKVLTLSTCTYKLADGTKLSYPNNYRFVVMAKLIDKDVELQDSVSLKLTKNAPTDAAVSSDDDIWVRNPAIYDNAPRIADHKAYMESFRETKKAS